MNDKMDAKTAAESFTLALRGAQYLDRFSQNEANASADDIAAQRAEKKDVDGAAFARVWRTKSRSAQLVKALVRAEAVARMIQQAQATIPGEAVPTPKELPAPKTPKTFKASPAPAPVASK